MLLDKIRSEFDRKSLFRAPLLPSAVFTAVSLVFSGVLLTLFPVVGANFLLFTPIIFVGWYVFGLIAVTLVGCLLVPVLPNDIPVFSRLNESRLGRIFLAFIMLGILGAGVLGLLGWTLIFLLMCLGEYTNRLPHKKQKPAKKKGIFV